MKRVDPSPPVVVIGGDFLAHHFDYAQAVPTMQALAQRFDAAFPHAQFVITLGNEDSGCDDYAIAARAAFLHSVAIAWAPLVNRYGAAPAFAASFANDGFYSATLPRTHLRALVIDDVFWSQRYRATCGGPSADRETLAELRVALHAQAGDRAWILAHIPPGIDVYTSTHGVHALTAFLDPQPAADWLSLVNDPQSHVAVVLTAHIHKFDFRVDGAGGAGAAPFFLVPSISPIFGNAPSFLTADVAPDGTLVRADDHTLLDGRWSVIGGTQDLGLDTISSASLHDLHARFARDPQLRATFARLYDGGARPEIDADDWPDYWCAQTAFNRAPYAACRANGASSDTH